jgi:uncharacterized membrane-anchored protein YjiN (DUF445 family)
MTAKNLVPIGPGRPGRLATSTRGQEAVPWAQPAKSTEGRKVLSTSMLDQDDRARLRELQRTKLLASGVLLASLAVLVIAKLAERHNPGFGFLAAFAEAATIGGLADWYAVVVLFRRPLGLPLPHTAIIPANHRQIAERLGAFVETHFLDPETIGAKLRQIDFAAAGSEWLRDPQRSDGLARFILRLLPGALTAAEDSGLRSFLARQLVDQVEAVQVAPLAAELMTTFVEERRHQRLLDEFLLTLARLMSDPVALDAIRQKIRAELPTLLNLYRADRFLLKKIATSTFMLPKEVAADESHPLRQSSTRSSRYLSRKSGVRPNTPQSWRHLSATSSPIHRLPILRRACGPVFDTFSNRTRGARSRYCTRISAGC